MPITQREQEGGHRQGQRRAAVVADHLEHGLVVAEGGPEVEADHRGQVVPVLLDQGFVEAERLTALVERLRR